MNAVVADAAAAENNGSVNKKAPTVEPKSSPQVTIEGNGPQGSVAAPNTPASNAPQPAPQGDPQLQPGTLPSQPARFGDLQNPQPSADGDTHVYASNGATYNRPDGVSREDLEQLTASLRRESDATRHSSDASREELERLMYSLRRERDDKDGRSARESRNGNERYSAKRDDRRARRDDLDELSDDEGDDLVRGALQRRAPSARVNEHADNVSDLDDELDLDKDDAKLAFVHPASAKSAGRRSHADDRRRPPVRPDREAATAELQLGLEAITALGAWAAHAVSQLGSDRLKNLVALYANINGISPQIQEILMSLIELEASPRRKQGVGVNESLRCLAELDDMVWRLRAKRPTTALIMSWADSSSAA